MMAVDKPLVLKVQQETVVLEQWQLLLVLSDALYEVADISEELYGKVIAAFEPLMNRETDYIKTTIDGIDFTFQLSRCEEVYT